MAPIKVKESARGRDPEPFTSGCKPSAIAKLVAPREDLASVGLALELASAGNLAAATARLNIRPPDQRAGGQLGRGETFRNKG